MHSLRNRHQDKLVASALALGLAALWLLIRGYQGFSGDAQIYAFQALARIHPALSGDLYLQNVSQDQYTVFSPFYAVLVQWLGLEAAARLLTMVFTVWIVAAAWNLAAAIADKRAAWLAAAFFLITTGGYGASGVFRIYEQFLTARLPAEALVITAICCYFRGMKLLGLLLSITALFIHPLMAFPGLILLILLRMPVRVSLVSALAGTLSALAFALLASGLPAASRALGVMDAQWLEVVQQRSQFLFLQLWMLRDWDLNLRPLIFTAYIAFIFDARTRRLCIAALLVGSCGLLVALIGCLIGPTTLLVQGQAWRWVWIPCLVSVLLLPAAVIRVWREPKCGPLLAVLSICGWAISAIGGTVCIVLAWSLWLLRKRLKVDSIQLFTWMAVTTAIAALAWVIFNSLALDHSDFAKIGSIIGVQVFALALFALLWAWLRNTQSVAPPLAAGALLLVISISIAPASIKRARILESPSTIEEFADWTAAIPPASTVLVAPPRDVGAFVWFTLHRPNYLALDQSAGVVFSRATAMEVRRRSAVLTPLMDPTWKILSGIRAGASGLKTGSPTRPLTADILIGVCADPKLGFVVSPQDVGFEPLRHQHAGAWKDWNLYDCARVRPSMPRT